LSLNNTGPLADARHVVLVDEAHRPRPPHTPLVRRRSLYATLIITHTVPTHSTFMQYDEKREKKNENFLTSFFSSLC
jgi:hypothetical protein